MALRMERGDKGDVLLFDKSQESLAAPTPRQSQTGDHQGFFTPLQAISDNFSYFTGNIREPAGWSLSLGTLIGIRQSDIDGKVEMDGTRGSAPAN